MIFFHYFQAYNQLPKWVPQVTKHPVYFSDYVRKSANSQKSALNFKLLLKLPLQTSPSRVVVIYPSFPATPLHLYAKQQPKPRPINSLPLT